MRTAQSFRLLRTALKPRPRTHYQFPTHGRRCFHSFTALQKIQTHVLSDIGEGVKEVQIIQWFVEEGAAVEEWAPLCEVQSDKASVEITSKYGGVVKKLHFDRDAIVQVGDGMLDIEVEGGKEDEEGAQEDGGQTETKEAETEADGPAEDAKAEDDAAVEEQQHTLKVDRESNPKSKPAPKPDSQSETRTKEESEPSKAENKEAAPGGSSSLATPAVRGLLKDHGLDITDIQGSGKDGRVMKEDVLKHIEGGKKPTQSPQATLPPTPKLEPDAKQVETTQSLTAIQSAMFKSMTKSLTIPHFLFSDSINFTALAAMRSRLNATRNLDTTPKYSYLPFVVKAVSLALNRYPLLNGRLDLSDTNKPKILLRSNHNISIAVDTPAGLLVPVIKNVNARSITSIANEVLRLSQLGQAGKLSNADLTGGTITVSNVGSIGGETVAPVLVENQLAILGLGKIKPTPVFADDGMTVQRADLMTASWSADHRVVDGATMARMATLVQRYLETPESMLVDMT